MKNFAQVHETAKRERKQHTKSRRVDRQKAAQANRKSANRKRHPKKQGKPVILNQWLEIEIERGQTATRFYPSNKALVKEANAMVSPPDFVYRRLNFPASVPPEYYWATSNPQARARGGTGIQRMTFDTWLDVIERERADGSGHIGPTGVGNLPRPAENGVCECQVCMRVSEETDD